MVAVEEVTDESPTVRTLAFSDGVMHGALPGQFAMVWVPGIGELPMSVMVSGKPGMAAFTVRRHGTASTGLYNTRVGEMIGIRGPYGNSFDPRPGKTMLVGGGTGLVPLMRLLSTVGPGRGGGGDVTVLIGARTKDEVFFEGLANEMLAGNNNNSGNSGGGGNNNNNNSGSGGNNNNSNSGGIPGRVIVTTEDGTRGERGLVTETVDRLLTPEAGFDCVYTCGPEAMMYRTVEIARSRGVFVQASIERMMKCGVGICGSCCMGPDLVCRDGTVFDGDHLASNPEFGRVHRNKAGVLESY